MGEVLEVTEIEFATAPPSLPSIAEQVRMRTGLEVAHEGEDSGLLWFVLAPGQRVCVRAVPEVDPDVTKLLGPAAGHLVGVNRPSGTHLVQLEASSAEPTLAWTVLLALEGLGGRPVQTVPDAVRERYSQRVSEAELLGRVRDYKRRGLAAAVLTVLLLPLMVAAWIMWLAWLVLSLPWRMVRGWRLRRASSLSQNG
jgi:hypothetical protein